MRRLLSRVRRLPTGFIIFLAFALPLLALVTGQFEVYCEDGCSIPLTLVAKAWGPLLILWLVVIVTLIVRSLKVGEERSK